MAKADPCSLLIIPSMKKACEDAAGNPAGGVVSALTGGGNVGISGDFRKLMLRTAEVGVGLLLIVVAANALLKGNSTVKIISSGVKKVSGNG